MRDTAERMRIGEYVLRERIGAGAMGVVYEAVRADGMRVALKLVDPAHRDDAYRLRRFEDEGIAGSIVNHPGVVAVLERGATEDGLPFIVMERVDGENLSALIRRGELGIADAIELSCQLLRALHAMHEVGIVHGDVKSANILVASHAPHALVLKLVDLGLSKVWFDESEPATIASISGTPDYMAPEIVLGHGVSPASDIYAASVLLYEMITGTTPFGGGAGAAILARQLEERPLPPSARVPEIDIPAELDRCVMRGLAKSPRARPRTAASFADALAAIDLDLRADARGHPRFTCDGPTQEWRGFPRGTPRSVGNCRRSMARSVHHSCGMQSTVTATELEQLLGEVDPLVIERILETRATIDEVDEALADLQDERNAGIRHAPSSSRVAEVREILEPVIEPAVDEDYALDRSEPFASNVED